MEQRAREIIQKLDYLKDERQPWEEEWADIGRYVLPRRSGFKDRERPSYRDVYDGTALGALNLMANGLVGYLISPQIRWFKLQLQDRDAMDLAGVRPWLEACENVLYNDFARSNLYEEVLEFFRDGGSVATATMYVEPNTETALPYFSTRHPKEIYLSANYRNIIDTVFRRTFFTARQVVQEFPKTAPEWVVKLASDKPYDTVEIIHAVFPREDRDVTSLNSRHKKYASFYIERKSGEILSEGGYDDLPYVVWRWSTNTDEVYGRGPSHDALSKIKRLNAISKTMMQAAQLAVEPPMNVPEHMRGSEAFIPRGMNYYRMHDEVAMPINLGANYPVGMDQEQDIRAIVENDFLVDFFLMLQRGPQGITATEVMERQAEKAAVLGPIIGRIESDVLDRVIEIAFRQAGSEGRLKPPPPALAKSGQPIEIDYIGPLAQAQKKFHVQQGVTHSINAFAPLLELEPTLHDLIDWDDLGRELLEHHGMPAKVIRDRIEIEKLRQAREKRMAEQQAAEQRGQLMQNYDKLAKPPQTGSPMDDLNKQLRNSMQVAKPGAPA